MSITPGTIITRESSPNRLHVYAQPGEKQYIGFVELVDVMGSDAAIVQAARISYGDGTKSKREDRGLIRYLLRHGHTSPFEMCEMKFHVRCPMDVWRQWIRHRTASVNEYSTRYSIAIDEMASTPVEAWRLQSTTNKQGSAGLLIKGTSQYPKPHGENIADILTDQEREFHQMAKKLYDRRIEFGIAREQARKDLPLSTFTEAYWKMDLHNLLHFLRLRMDSHAQLEIRRFAEAISLFVEEKFPLAWSAFEDYVLNAVTFSAMEVDALGTLLVAEGMRERVLDMLENLSLSPGEKDEFKAKLDRVANWHARGVQS